LASNQQKGVKKTQTVAVSSQKKIGSKQATNSSETTSNILPPLTGTSMILSAVNKLAQEQQDHQITSISPSGAVSEAAEI